MNTRERNEPWRDLAQILEAVPPKAGTFGARTGWRVPGFRREGAEENLAYLLLPDVGLVERRKEDEVTLPRVTPEGRRFMLEDPWMTGMSRSEISTSSNRVVGGEERRNR